MSKKFDDLFNSSRNIRSRTIFEIQINDSDSEDTEEAKKLEWALYVAAENNNKDLVIDILNDPITNCQSYNDAYGRYNRTPLHIACEKGFSNIVKLLLDKGTNTDVKQGDGKTPLHIAANGGHDEIVKLLLKHGADANIIDVHGETPLHASSTELITRMLLENGADLETKSEAGSTPLHEACRKKFVQIVELLLKKGADKDAQHNFGRTPLFEAALYGYEKIVEILLNHGADVNRADEDGRTPLHISWDDEITKMLVDKGADLEARTNNGETPLISVVAFEKVAKTLVECGADFDISTYGTGKTPLHEAVACGSSIFEYFLENGAISDARDRFHQSPLYDMFVYDKHKEIELFLKYCAYADEFVERCLGENRGPQRVRRIFKRHVIKLGALNIHVVKDLDFASYVKEMSDWSEKCKSEAERTMCKITQKHNVTYHDILTQSVNRIAIFMNNENIRGTLELACYEKMFPIYHKVILNKFKAASRKCDFSRVLAETLVSLFDDHLPYDVILEIASYLKRNDTVRFMKSWSAS